MNLNFANINIIQSVPVYDEQGRISKENEISVNFEVAIYENLSEKNTDLKDGKKAKLLILIKKPTEIIKFNENFTEPQKIEYQGKFYDILQIKKLQTHIEILC